LRWHAPASSDAVKKCDGGLARRGHRLFGRGGEEGVSVMVLTVSACGPLPGGALHQMVTSQHKSKFSSA
jgi:hypothetical protein